MSSDIKTVGLGLLGMGIDIQERYLQSVKTVSFCDISEEHNMQFCLRDGCIETTGRTYTNLYNRH